MATPQIIKGQGLIFGLNYSKDSSCTLNGCINDAHMVSRYVQSLGLPVSVYTDDLDFSSCTGIGMLQKLYELAVQSYSDNLDFVWIHYSGHGSSVKDASGDELDGLDECLVPVDYKTNGLVSDDILKSVFKCFNPKTRVLAVFDCCHSGTIGDIKYSWEGPTKVLVENILCSTKAKVITLSGCLDNQTSADAFNVNKDNKYTGALTSCLLTILSENKAYKTNVFQMLISLREKLKQKGFSQVPKICSTHNLAKDQIFLPL
jgi:hypothetical protein